ncbi:ABC transporter permease subunit [Streptomyces sp. SPB074]|uniref:ABC transporter permease subunit n=1 Tax=Streptomyces sp. (strain SPB074) TaxID=465543 RepID=UPI00017F1448|nr:ABC transporter permease subunit [Streptomyces sp. SPB074]
MPLGTDALGRDVLSRLLCGGRRLVLTAGAATLLTSLVGGAAGVLAGLLPVRAGDAAQRLFDVLAVVPPLLLVLVLAAGFPGSAAATVLAVALATAPFSVRVLRAATARLLTTGYVETARARGDGALRVARHDLLPQLAGTALTEAGLRFVASLHLAATAGFLGLGGSGAEPDWGRMVSENLPGAPLATAPFLLPTLLLVTLSVCVGLLADRYAGAGAEAAKGATR